MKTNILTGIFTVSILTMFLTPLYAQEALREEREEMFIIRFYKKADEMRSNPQTSYLAVDAGEGTLYLDDIILEFIDDKKGNSFYKTALEIGKKISLPSQTAIRSLRVHDIKTLASLDVSPLELEEIVLRHLFLANALNVWEWGYPTSALGPIPTFFFARFEFFFIVLESALQWKDILRRPVLLFDYYPREKILFLKYATVRIDAAPGAGVVLIIPGTEKIIAKEHLNTLETIADFNNAAERFSQEAFKAIFSEN